LLDLYRLQGDQRKFETTAMEFALFAEADPPAWEPVLMPVLPHGAKDERRDEPRYQAEIIRFEGEMTGIRDPQLAALARFGADREYVNINSARLARMDFVCAGNLANALAAFKKEGKTVRILYPNHLVATLLRMLKVDENAVLVAPKSAT
jgi:anti-anti-sigma regulatory factor